MCPRPPIPQEDHSLLILRVLEFVPGMKDAEVVDVLDIALTKVKTHMKPLCKEVKRVECFGLGFSDGWDVGRSRKGLIPCKGPSGVLDDDSLFVPGRRGQIMQQRAFVVGIGGAAETVCSVSQAMRGYQSTKEPSRLTSQQPSLQPESQ